jgi:hypothetical protein
MKEATIDRQRAVVAYSQATEVAEPSYRALDDPAPLVAPQRSPILPGRLVPVVPVGRDQFNAASGQLLAQRIAIVPTVPDHPLGFLPRSASLMSPLHTDRRNA